MCYSGLKVWSYLSTNLFTELGNNSSSKKGEIITWIEPMPKADTKFVINVELVEDHPLLIILEYICFLSHLDVHIFQFVKTCLAFCPNSISIIFTFVDDSSDTPIAILQDFEKIHPK